jgi:hypothetical protein
MMGQFSSIEKLQSKLGLLGLVFLVTTTAISLFVTIPDNPARAEDGPPGTNIRIERRGNGWDVYVQYHIRKVSISQVKFTGGTTGATANYPQPTIVEYSFEVDNEHCGGNFDPITGRWDNPTAGYATIEIYFPPGTFVDPDLPGITEITVIRRSPCGEDGAANLIPQPVIESEDVADIAKSIWERIELPELEVSANPKTGIVTVPAWFWLALSTNKTWWPGTDPNEGGQPFGVIVTIPLPGQTHTVQVLVDVTKVTWDFGDYNNGKRFMLTTFVGKQYPKKSNVTHAYNNEWTYDPQATLHFVPRYAWNGGGWTALPTEFRETIALGEYRVREAQTILIEPDQPKR